MTEPDCLDFNPGFSTDLLKDILNLAMNIFLNVKWQYLIPMSVTTTK